MQMPENRFTDLFIRRPVLAIVVNLLIVKERTSTAYRYDRALVFEVVDTTVRDGAWYGREPGVVHPVLPWSTEFLSGEPQPESR